MEVQEIEEKDEENQAEEKGEEKQAEEEEEILEDLKEKEEGKVGVKAVSIRLCNTAFNGMNNDNHSQCTLALYCKMLQRANNLTDIFIV